MNDRNRIAIAVVGRAGDGSYSTANILALILRDVGCYSYGERSIYSNIQGRPTAFYVVADTRPVYWKDDGLDILIAFDGESLRERYHELQVGSVCVVDSSARNPAARGVPINLTDSELEMFANKGVEVYKIPMADLARENFSNPIIRNTIGAGVVTRLLNIPHVYIERLVQKKFGDKKGGNDLIAQNLKAFDLGVAVATNPCSFVWQVSKQVNPGRLFALGNDLIALGALYNGCRYFVGYPITPATEIFEYMMANIGKFGGVAVQATSELEAANKVIGASYAGARAMTATSGPGFSLMQEVLSGAGIAETPLVIALVQRPGPGTGMPTRTAQEDLMQAVFGGHGEFPRVIISPATPEECFLFGAHIFNLAERYQCPSILLTEQSIGQAHYTLNRLPLEKVVLDRGKVLTGEEIEKMRAEKIPYARYVITDDGISPRMFPGTPGFLVSATMLEHDERGHPTEDSSMRIAQVGKRLRKYATMERDGFLPCPVVEGKEDARIGFIGYGSTLSPVLCAIKDLGEQGVSAKYLRLRTLWPIDSTCIERFVESVEHVYIVEQNATGQLMRLIRMMSDIPVKKLSSILQFDGRRLSKRTVIDGVKR